jgi:nitrogen fixation NifU-like protein
MSDDALYHAAIMERARAADGDHRLAETDADATVTVDNPLCGDRVTLDLRMDGRRIAAVGYRVRGCALCRASASVVAEVLAGAGRRETADAGSAVRGLLEAGIEPAEPWSALGIFRPVGNHKSRHGCVLLPLEAVRQALDTLAL